MFLADLRAGLLVALIALPLCLGIAIASGFPPIAGIVTAIVGGLVATPLGSARLTIKGPAAGLIVIAIASVEALGDGDPVAGYRRTLAVGVVAAALQIAFALGRVATLGIAMSPSVVSGMLAAIGVIIMARQAHTVMGVVPDADGPLGALAEIPASLAAANPQILLIGVASLAILFGWPLLRARWATIIPAGVVALAVAVPLGLWFDLAHPHTYEFWSRVHRIGPDFLVGLPGSLGDAVVLPDFSQVTSPQSIRFIVMFALVGTVESTLSCLAVDSLDPARRASDLNRDLRSVGVGNLIAASIGGLPMITEIVRSKANIDAGARSSRANFAHGAALLLLVGALPGIVKTIPQAALGAMLVYTGSRLASPGQFLRVRRIGLDQFAVFTTTLVVTLATDLLIGIGAGLALEIVLHLARGAGLRTLFGTRLEEERRGDEVRLTLHGAAAFPSLLPIRRALDRLGPDVRRVVVDLGDVVIVDHTFLARVQAMADEFPDAVFELVGADDMSSSSTHPHAVRRRRRR